MQKVACSWSGGKDSCFALMETLKAGHELRVLVNMMNENGIISRSHGLPFSILEQQARSMNVPLIALPTSWKDYESNFTSALTDIRQRYQVTEMVFGDIDLQPHRDWEEMVCRNANLKATLPLWQKDRRQLVFAMMDAGIETMIVSCNLVLGESFLGRPISPELVAELEEKGVDPCGENGEFHTLVTSCPLFSQQIDVPSFEKVRHEDYWFLKWTGR